MGSDNEFRRKRFRCLLALKRLAAFSLLFLLVLYIFQHLNGHYLNSSSDQHHGLSPASVFRKPSERTEVVGGGGEDDDDAHSSKILGKVEPEGLGSQRLQQAQIHKSLS